MTRRLLPALVLITLLVLLSTSVAGQEAASTEIPASAGPASAVPVSSGSPAPSAPSSEPTQAPLPTAVPYADGPLVQLVLFFSPTCGHCHLVITETLPAVYAQIGGTPIVTYDQTITSGQVANYLMSNGRLQVLLIDVTSTEGQATFVADGARLGMDQAGVPRLDVGDTYLVGSTDIPAQLPGIVAAGLAGSGVAWPPVPGLADALAPFVEAGAVPAPGLAAMIEPTSVASVAPAAAPALAATPTATASAATTTTASIAPTAVPTPSASNAAPAEASPSPDEAFAVIPVGSDGGPLDKLGEDPLGNGIAVIVLVLLVLSIILAPLLAARGALPAFPDWLVIVLAAVGMAVAAYLATVETSGSEAVCGPVGDCNAVQQSSYARLFGVHVGVLGLLGYGLMALLWIVARVADREAADWARLLIAVGAVIGVAFSAYLTFLEPFVIGATCMWCITSAIVMLALLWVSAGPGWAAWRRIQAGAGDGTEPATAEPGP